MKLYRKTEINSPNHDEKVCKNKEKMTYKPNYKIYIAPQPGFTVRRLK